MTFQPTVRSVVFALFRQLDRFALYISFAPEFRPTCLGAFYVQIQRYKTGLSFGFELDGIFNDQLYPYLCHLNRDLQHGYAQMGHL